MAIAVLVFGPAAESQQTHIHGLKFSRASFMEAAVWRAESRADLRVIYGDDNSAVQFADLRIPEGPTPEAGYPVIVFLHGGGWLAEWSKDYSEAFVEKLVLEGFATWDVEYRRMGHSGGGYPGTFEDVADAVDYLRALAGRWPLDLSSVIVAGHSAGGHLALWAAGRSRLDESSPLYRKNPLPLRAVFSIAGVNDLELSLKLGNRTDVLELAGIASLEAGRARLDEVDPGRLLPLKVQQLLYIGDQDSQWRLEMTDRYAAKAKEAGDDVSVVIVSGANHMDVVDAASGFAQVLGKAANQVLRKSGN